MKTFMSIGAHIGDAELTTGCVLAHQSLKGDKIITVALTAGERGNPKHMSVADYRVQKVNEANEFAKTLNGEAIVLDYVDGELPDNDEARTIVANLIRKYRPNYIFTHWENSMHKDHATAHRIVVDAAFWAALDMGDKIQGLPHWAPVYFSENWEDREGFEPYLYVNCSDGYELWKQAISKHWFIMNSSSFRYFDYYTHLSFVRGCLSKYAHAQCFNIKNYQKFTKMDGF
ncbi:MAG: PIG-L deacetylase family protein [Bacilli bacterium]